jgi:hypothetical protein
MRRAATEYAERVFTLDTRSLALMRIAVAATVLVDLVTRLVHCAEHYSDDGVLPRETARSLSWLVDTSLLAVSGSPAWVAFVFVVAIGLAIAVLVGWRTRLATLLLWLVLLSIQHRNPLLWDHRDALFSISLVCGLLLPWGEAFSLDARTRGVRSDQYFGVAAAAYVVQLACIYLFAFLLKDGPEWRSDFTAVERAVSLQYWARPAANILVEHPTLASALTVGVLGFEAAVAPLLLCPWRTGLARWLVVGGLCALQLGFAVFLWLDTFPMIAAAMTLGLLPASLWSRRAVPADPRSERSAISGLALVLLVYTLALNVMSLDKDATSSARRPAELFGITQNWSMFAPSPTRWDGWFIVESKQRDGSAIDLLTGRVVDWARPQSFREGIRTTRELVYLRRLLAGDDARRADFAAARCRTEPTPATISVYFVGVFEGHVQAPELLIAHDCAP